MDKCKNCKYKSRPKQIYPCSDCISKNLLQHPITCDDCIMGMWFCDKRGKHNRRLRTCNEFRWS